MRLFRSVVFWMHLVCGVVAGVVVLIMSITGVALTYEKQMLEWADRGAWTAPSPVGARHLPRRLKERGPPFLLAPRVFLLTVSTRPMLARRNGFRRGEPLLCG